LLVSLVFSVIASAAKQSSRTAKPDCFVASLLAMTNLIVLLKEEIKMGPKRT